MYASVPTGERPAAHTAFSSKSEAGMTTQTRWTVQSVANDTPFAAWLRRKGFDMKRCTAEIHEWENEGGALLTSSQAGPTSSK
jgi:hypothetical protein